MNKSINLTCYHDPVRASDIEIGDICYLIGIDQAIPSITSFYYIGHNLDPRDVGQGDNFLYFQDSISYYAGVRFNDTASPKSSAAIFLYKDAQLLDGFYSLSSAAEILMYYAHQA